MSIYYTIEMGNASGRYQDQNDLDSASMDPENPDQLASGEQDSSDTTREGQEDNNGENGGNGVYFGTHFVLGGQRILTSDAENFLFGGAAEPRALSTARSSSFRPTRVHTAPTIKSAINLNKDTLKLLSTQNETETEADSTDTNRSLYQIQFKLDALEACLVKVYLLAKQCSEDGESRFQPSFESDQCTLFCSKGFGQLVETPLEKAFDLSKYEPEALIYKPEVKVFPVVITVDVVKDSKSEDVYESEGSGMIESQTTYATLIPTGEGGYSIKPVKVTTRYGGTTYLVHDLYGSDSVTDDGGRECVICMCDPRNITVYPCNHMCLCATCAELFRFQTDKCPICRSTVKALLKVQSSNKGKTKTGGTTLDSSQDSELATADAEEAEITLVKNSPTTASRPITVV